MLDALQGLLTQWRIDAEVLRRRGAAPQADTIESLADDVARFARRYELEALTMTEAALESGYSEESLRRLIHREVVQNVSTDRRMRIRRCDLPRKAKQRRLGNGEVDLAGEVLANRGLRVLPDELSDAA